MELILNLTSHPQTHSACKQMKAYRAAARRSECLLRHRSEQQEQEVRRLSALLAAAELAKDSLLLDQCFITAPTLTPTDNPTYSTATEHLKQSMERQDDTTALRGDGHGDQLMADRYVERAHSIAFADSLRDAARRNLQAATNEVLVLVNEVLVLVNVVLVLLLLSSSRIMQGGSRDVLVVRV